MRSESIQPKPQALYLELMAPHDQRSVAKLFSWWLKDGALRFVQPALEVARAQGLRQCRSPHAPKDCDFHVGTALMTASGSLSERNGLRDVDLQRLLARIETESVESVHILMGLMNEYMRPSDQFIRIFITPATHPDDHSKFSIESTWPPPPAIEDQQAAMVLLGRLAMTLFPAACGILTVAPVNTLNFFQIRKSRRNLPRRAAWGTFLSSDHVKTLGGIEWVVSEAPVLISEAIDAPDGSAAYLQASKSIDANPPNLDSLEAFLAPIFSRPQ